MTKFKQQVARRTQTAVSRRYWIFGFHGTYPVGGMSDLQHSTRNRHRARKIARRLRREYGWIQILDTHTGIVDYCDYLDQ